MAIAVGPSQVVKLLDNVLSARDEEVRNDGPDAVFISKDPQLAASGADTWQLAANATLVVSLALGEALYAITAAGKAASVELI